MLELDGTNCWFENGSWAQGLSDRLLQRRTGDGHDNLFYELSEGDLCFRWNNISKAMLGVSWIAGEPSPSFGQVWENGNDEPCWIVELEPFAVFRRPITLPMIRAIQNQVIKASKGWDYAPFNLYRGQLLRPAQRYLSKVSPKLADIFMICGDAVPDFADVIPDSS